MREEKFTEAENKLLSVNCYLINKPSVIIILQGNSNCKVKLLLTNPVCVYSVDECIRIVFIWPGISETFQSEVIHEIGENILRLTGTVVSFFVTYDVEIDLWIEIWIDQIYISIHKPVSNVLKSLLTEIMFLPGGFILISFFFPPFILRKRSIIWQY